MSYSKPYLYAEGCLTCGGDNIWLPDYGRRYICQVCSKHLKLPTGESVQLKASKSGRKINFKVFYHGMRLRNCKVDIANLRIFGMSCMATFAGESNTIILLLN